MIPDLSHYNKLQTKWHRFTNQPINDIVRCEYKHTTSVNWTYLLVSNSESNHDLRGNRNIERYFSRAIYQIATAMTNKLRAAANIKHSQCYYDFNAQGGELPKPENWDEYWHHIVGVLWNHTEPSTLDCPWCTTAIHPISWSSSCSWS